MRAAEKMSECSVIKETLKTLCCTTGWSYGVLWGFDHTNSSLLTLKDGYFEEQMGVLIDSMLLQMHVLGSGVIGQAAFTGNHEWMCSDSYHQRQNSFGSLEVFQDDSEFYCQFSMGIKTIAIISVEQWGVVQLGSTQKIFETKGFINQVKELFRGMYKGQKIEEQSSIDNQFLGMSTQFNQDFQHSSYYTEGLLETNHSLVTLENAFPECLSPLGEIANMPFTTLLSNDPPLPDRLVPLSNLDGGKCIMDVSGNLPTTSLQSSLTNEKAFDIELESWNETLIPVVNCDDLYSYAQEPNCISENFSESKVGTSESLFSKLGLDKILDGMARSSCSFGNSIFEDQSSFSASKRRKMENHSGRHNQVKFQSPVEPDGEVSRKEMAKSICDNSSACISSSKGQVEKGKKKKAKPGTKPRPKDRQMIQDRLAELRELIPNGEKMSIDRLLERTIRHLNFMEGLKKHAESMKQVDNAKSQKGRSRNNGGGGVTWACEVGDQSMACPLMVEDLTTPGQMLIEMLCEEHGSFLEIVDIIRGFGLTILKGVMEVRETKMWAHFIVEAKGNRQVIRHEIFSSLIQLLQMTSQSAAANANDHHFNSSSIINSDAPLFNDCQYAVPFPVNLGNALLQCANL